jgi:hypothetical protein
MKRIVSCWYRPIQGFFGSHLTVHAGDPLRARPSPVALMRFLRPLEIAVERDSPISDNPVLHRRVPASGAERHRTVSKRAAFIFEEPHSEYGRWK